MDRRARDGRTLIRRHVGVEPDPLELAHVEVELFARDLEEPGGVALAELALAEIDGRGVVGVDGDPGIDCVGIGRTGDVAARRRSSVGQGPTQAEADDQRAAALEQVATRERHLSGERGHWLPPAIRVEAS
jgi:hypothetical protein